MTWLEFLSATIGQLVWPILVLAIVLLLRDPIKNLASSPRLTTLKAGPSGIELAFREELKEVQQGLAQSDTPELESAGTEEEHSGGIDKSGLTSFLAEMERLADVSPRSVVTETHARLERALREAVERVAVRDITPGSGTGVDRPGGGMRQLIRAATKQGWLPEVEESALLELSQLRNRVAHEPDQAITTETALWYARLAADLATHIHYASGRTTAAGPFL